MNAATEAAARDALARSDEGCDPLPGDPDLIAEYERLCQEAWDRFQHAQQEADRAQWLASQCGGCEEGGTGEACDEHWEGEPS